MAPKKRPDKFPASTPGHKSAPNTPEYYYCVGQYKGSWTANICHTTGFGKDVEVIRKDGFPTEAAATSWAIYHCNMRDYRPYVQEVDFHPFE